MSYIFGDYSEQVLGSPNSTEQMQFKQNAEKVPVDFVTTTLEFKANDKDETVYEVTMDIGWIAKKY